MLNLPAKSGTIQVAQSHSMRPANLIAITGSNAASGSADVLAIRRAFVERPIFREMPGEDHVCPIADAQIISVPGPATSEFVEFLNYTRRINHHARANHASDPRRKNAAGE